MACIFGFSGHLIHNKLQNRKNFALFSVLPDNAFTMCGDECL